jgi:hypothetical protein
MAKGPWRARRRTDLDGSLERHTQRRARRVDEPVVQLLGGPDDRGDAARNSGLDV